MKSSYDFRLERRLHLPQFDFGPIDAAEERMSANVLLTFGTATEPFDGQFRQELRAQNDRKHKLKNTMPVNYILKKLYIKKFSCYLIFYFYNF